MTERLTENEVNSMDTDIYRAARLAYRLGRQDQQRILEVRLRKHFDSDKQANQLRELAAGMTDELVDFHAIIRAAEESSTSEDSVNSGFAVNKIPPGHVGFTDPSPTPVHEERLCLKHAPQVEVTWIAGDGCPLCEAYEHESALKEVVERAMCHHGADCSPVATHNGCNARAVLDRLYGGYLPSRR